MCRDVKSRNSTASCRNFEATLHVERYDFQSHRDRFPDSRDIIDIIRSIGAASADFPVANLIEWSVSGRPIVERRGTRVFDDYAT